ncbi:hypothetical protein VNO78_08714 [Psophocarpus tetragonolobus]|uniref:Uncharacterized protein n=1 Tax=Psophocarpus tetragonolobus TaxID=3891 RepID=A0AAN9T5W5_PSOTE
MKFSLTSKSDLLFCPFHSSSCLTHVHVHIPCQCFRQHRFCSSHSETTSPETNRVKRYIHTHPSCFLFLFLILSLIFYRYSLLSSTFLLSNLDLFGFESLNTLYIAIGGCNLRVQTKHSGSGITDTCMMGAFRTCEENGGFSFYVEESMGQYGTDYCWAPMSCEHLKGNVTRNGK